MYLKAITLQGFKSFADPTVLRFEPGVTAIVGPNGCGKSNIADAIRWVLGEQSAKALRGGKMQDVIFEGTDSRRPAQICEVSLLLTDCERQLGSDFHEIEIMRRGHRDGLGEYFFNGQPCRLKDIQNQFMDTGVGRTSYSLMAQGQIDQVLSSKPEERRAVFEEAAGITKYKSQRREALAKLALTDQNLARVTDIVGEVSRQIGSLRRQASKAMRYKRLGHRLRHLSLAWSARQHERMASELAALETTVSSLRAGAAERRAHLDARREALEARKADRSRFNQRIQEAQQAAFDLRSQKEQADNAANLAQIKRSGLEERIGAARDDLAETQMQLHEVSARADTGAQDKERQLSLLGTSDASFQERNRGVAVAEGKLSRLEQELQQAKFGLLQSESAVARLRADCSSYEVDQKASGQRHQALDRELGQVRDQKAAAAKFAEEAGRRVETVLGEKARADEGLVAAQRALADFTKEFREAQRRMQEADRQLAQRTARLKLLQQLQERWEGFGEGAKALLQGKLDADLSGAGVRPIAKGLQVKADCARAIEALLGPAAEAVGVGDVATARRILAGLERDQIGSAILRIEECRAENGPGRPLPAGLQPAAAGLDEGSESGAVAEILEGCYIADDLGAFLEYWRQNRDFAFLAVATRKGEVADRRGLVSGGHLGGAKQGGGIVQRELDLRETARALAGDQRLHDEHKAAIEALSASLAETERALEGRRAEVLSGTQHLAAAQTEQRNAQRAAEEIAGRLRRMEADLAALAEARDGAARRWEKARAGVDEAEGEAGKRRLRVAEFEGEIAAARADLETKRESLAQARLELAERRQKVELLDRGLGEMEKRRGQLSELLEQREREIEAWTEQVGEWERQANAERDRAAELARTLEVAQGQVDKIRAELASIEGEIASLEAEQTALRDRSDAAHEELSAQEVRLAEHRQRMQFLAEEVFREHSAEVATLDWKRLLWRAEDEPEGLKTLDLDDEEEADPGRPAPGAGAPGQSSQAEPAPSLTGGDGPQGRPSRSRKPKVRGEPTEADLAALDATNWEEIKAQVDGLRQWLAGMGAVNLVAIEEYAELKQRHDFLKAQSGDLASARAELVAAIDEINRTSQRQFTVTFEQIRKDFAFTFQALFSGGRAELELVQTEDPLECGIDIVAQPPGTRLRGISLLSGGQRTLTAVALLFALYMVKPSPFCLLDELDAQLDESNIGRFTDLLKRFVDDSQFILITHNKRTVAAANAIYGITMEERGVSKVISMRFNREREEVEAHPRNLAEAVAGAPAVAADGQGPPAVAGGLQPSAAVSAPA